MDIIKIASPMFIPYAKILLEIKHILDCIETLPETPPYFSLLREKKKWGGAEGGCRILHMRTTKQVNSSVW